jgi:hypothetical protein
MARPPYVMEPAGDRHVVRGPNGPIAHLTPRRGRRPDEALAELLDHLAGSWAGWTDYGGDGWNGRRGWVRLVPWGQTQLTILRADSRGTRLELFRTLRTSLASCTIDLFYGLQVTSSDVPLPPLPRRLSADAVREVFWRDLNPGLARPLFRGPEDPALTAHLRKPDLPFLVRLVTAVFHARGLPAAAGQVKVKLPTLAAGSSAYATWDGAPTMAIDEVCSAIGPLVERFSERLGGAERFYKEPPSPTLDALEPIRHAVMVDAPSAMERADARRFLAELGI